MGFTLWLFVTWRTGKWPIEIVDLPNLKMVIFQFTNCKRLPEDKSPSNTIKPPLTTIKPPFYQRITISIHQFSGPTAQPPVEQVIQPPSAHASPFASQSQRPRSSRTPQRCPWSQPETCCGLGWTPTGYPPTGEPWRSKIERSGSLKKSVPIDREMRG